MQDNVEFNKMYKYDMVLNKFVVSLLDEQFVDYIQRPYDRLIATFTNFRNSQSYKYLNFCCTNNNQVFDCENREHVKKLE